MVSIFWFHYYYSAVEKVSISGCNKFYLRNEYFLLTYCFILTQWPVLRTDDQESNVQPPVIIVWHNLILSPLCVCLRELISLHPSWDSWQMSSPATALPLVMSLGLGHIFSFIVLLQEFYTLWGPSVLDITIIHKYWLASMSSCEPNFDVICWCLNIWEVTWGFPEL